MNQAAQLKQFLIKHVEFLRLNPESWSFDVNQGRIAATAGDTLSYDYQYSVIFTLKSYPKALNTLFSPLISWLYVHQSDLFQDEQLAEDAVAFQLANMAEGVCDITIHWLMYERICLNYQAPSCAIISQNPPDIPYDPFDYPDENDMITALHCPSLTYK